MAIKVLHNGDYVDPSQVRIWDGSAFVAPQAIYEWVADEFIKRWPASITYRMNKVGESHAFASQVPVIGWESDPTEPGMILSGLLTGSGVTTVEVSFSVRSGSGYYGSVLVKLDGVTIITIDAYNLSSYQVKTASWTGIATEGQQVTVETSTSHGVGVNAPSFVKVTSAVPHKVVLADGFDRADTNQTTGLSNAWWHFNSYAGIEYPRIESRRLRGSGGVSAANTGNGAVMKSPMPEGNYFVQALAQTLPVLTSSTEPCGLIIRANESSNHYNNSAGPEAIFCVLSQTRWRIYRQATGTNGGPSEVLATGNGSFTSGGVMRAEVVGDQLTFSYGGNVLGYVSIAGRGSGRQVGICTTGDTPRLDDFVAGQLGTPTLSRQRASQTGSIADPAGNKVKVSPLVSDATYPASVTDGVIRVSGSGRAHIQLSVGGSGNVFGGTRVTIEKNGVAIGYLVNSSHSTATSVWISNVELSAGDELILWATRNAIGSISGPVNNAVVDLIPAP
ncbi:hypothetical protein SEA_BRUTONGASTER_48 [Gordonia phage BrutonGaster]|uniref:Uncharacterized protein n=1 Tax=Gordonia phage BrutonGaster TaxID=2530116 RepID=A0A482JH54_9CAUD|nr:hypothetical protein HOV26_gp134 [Gordonia phage BrutonGaster]QBP33265.1 hypothetical protein SEA_BRUTONGASTER_48 [Gordonia phage BrutonGaster]